MDKKLLGITRNYQKASLTVEAALILPVFLYFMLAFLYYIQIFTIQEQIQSSITKMGLNLAKSSYVLKDFPSLEDALSFDFTVFGEDYDISLEQLADTLTSESVLKLYAKKYLDTPQINHSCIKNGFDGISFTSSSLLGGDDYIDIVVSYLVKLPLKLFALNDMQMVQRVRLRCWTGYEVAAAYQTSEETKNNEEIVYITETGSVYHKSETCSHIKLSIRSVSGIPNDLRNDNGAKYYPCEACCIGATDMTITYYITSDGTRYHSLRDCSKLKRSVKEISFSEVGSRKPCKRCYP
ncbi:MAG TPA: hypothetical protein VN258_08500 [Mobilitalea sp.]|nr:hypothetical protein [Mobilitalea sp.]